MSPVYFVTQVLRTLTRLARIAVDQGCPRLEWDVLEWNESAIAVYHRVGANVLTEWRIMRIADEPLAALAATDSSSDPSEHVS